MCFSGAHAPTTGLSFPSYLPTSTSVLLREGQMRTAATQQSQQMRTELAPRSLGTRWAKTGLTAEGSAVVGALAVRGAGLPRVLRNHPSQQAGGWT